MSAPARREMFQPVGDRARWRIVYDRITHLDYEDVITYETLAEALGLDATRHRNLIHQAMIRAGRELSVMHSRSVENVRGIGYRVVKPNEHVRLAGVAQKKSGRILKTGTRHVQNVDLSKLNDNERAIVYATLRALRFQEQQFEALRIRQDRQAQLVESVERAGRETAETVTDHDSRLRELEEKLARLTGGGSQS